MTDECRKAFEEWHGRIFEQHLPSLRQPYGYPQDGIVQSRWRAWQEAWNRRAGSGVVEAAKKALEALKVIGS